MVNFSWFLFLKFHCWCTKICSISEYWLCVSVALPNSLLGRVVFWWSLSGCLCRLSCHLQTATVLLLSFKFGCLLFLFLVWSLWLELPILCWIEVMKMDDTLLLFLILVGKLLVFAYWVQFAVASRKIKYLGINLTRR